MYVNDPILDYLLEVVKIIQFVFSYQRKHWTTFIAIQVP